MKKILALAAVAALTAGVSAYAANPFSDVTPSDWAYQAVVDLSEQGVVEGYPDGTFKAKETSPVMKWLRSSLVCSLKKIS
ncbi:MAG: S-layer homology domain-containing protein [Dialister sp.]|jgi:hypothetical protein|nr:S-layer homology domain-containing protein [Dialister sp.]